MRYNTEYVKQQFRKGKRMKYVFFWGHTEKPGKVTKACFSQWYDCRFEVGGVVYHTAEQYMMAQKAILFQDEAVFQEIMAASHPKQFKALGRKIANFRENLWNEHKYQIVVEGNLAKFSQNKELGNFLAQTGSRILVEASPYDKIWGIGMAVMTQKWKIH